ncbi:ABC transporter ATP-binding protein [Rhizobium sp. LjRoot30]|uniref:ABC transporter ATP-binding protein n=1 Tax=Rhizobium sp. LjRoot30 TaxID=3342320 RepID=UPI003ECF7A96
MIPTPLLRVENLAVSLRLADGRLLPILNDISFAIGRGDTLGIVGESGSGKTILSLAVIGLLPESAVVSGQIVFDGQPLTDLDDKGLCRIRGSRIGMIFQEPTAALNPAMTIADQIAEGIVLHRGTSWRDARRQAIDLLDRVRIDQAAKRADDYPHELSGGQRQRVGIAIALALEPELLIADEPTTALDATVQREVLGILTEFVREKNMALMLVSHNLGVVAHMAGRMLVLYAGARMEEGSTADVLGDPRNPYTRGLLAALPGRTERGRRMVSIPGNVPSLARLPPGCRFAGRCPEEIPACSQAEPGWRAFADGRGVRCLRALTMESV